MHLGLHHFHLRKRLHQKHQTYPHPDKFVRYLDGLIYIVGILGPVLTIPQVYAIWVIKDASGVSGLTWSAYLVFAFFWLLYGIVHKEKPIIISNCLWIVTEIIIVVGIFKYA